jgi:hypothetical protein
LAPRFSRNRNPRIENRKSRRGVNRDVA